MTKIWVWFPELTKRKLSWWLALVISVLGRQRQMDPWSSLVSQSSLACLVSSGPERDLVKKKSIIIPEVVYTH